MFTPLTDTILAVSLLLVVFLVVMGFIAEARLLFVIAAVLTIFVIFFAGYLQGGIRNSYILEILTTFIMFIMGSSLSAYYRYRVSETAYKCLIAFFISVLSLILSVYFYFCS